MKSFKLLVPLLTVASVSAHGFFSSISIGGKTFDAPSPGKGEKNTVIRQITTGFPIKGANNPDINCGPGGNEPSSLIANANPGSQLELFWKGDDGNNFPHNTGAMITFLASCGDTCDKFNSKDAKWFKIDEKGKTPNTNNWKLGELMKGQPDSVVLPKHLAPGNYLLMHQIIALHLADSKGGAEFYSGCAQLSVGGTETGKPKPEELGTFPGEYKDDDPGIFVPDVFEPKSVYKFPGTEIASFVKDGTPSDPQDQPKESPGSDDVNPSPTSNNVAPTPSDNGNAPPKDQPKQSPGGDDPNPSPTSNNVAPTPSDNGNAPPTKTKKPKKPKKTCTSKKNDDDDDDDDDSKHSPTPTPTPGNDDQRRGISHTLRALRRHHAREFRAQIH